MKRTMFHAGAERWAVGVCLLGMLVPCAWAAEPAETFRFENTCVGNRLTNQFLLRNDGLEAVKVLSATPSCDCIRVLRFPAQVEAGATGVVEVLFVPDKAGEVDYRVYVRTAVTNQPEIEFAIQGVVAAAPPRARRKAPAADEPGAEHGQPARTRAVTRSAPARAASSAAATPDVTPEAVPSFVRARSPAPPRASCSSPR